MRVMLLEMSVYTKLGDTRDILSNELSLDRVWWWLVKTLMIYNIESDDLAKYPANQKPLRG